VSPRSYENGFAVGDVEIVAVVAVIGAVVRVGLVKRGDGGGAARPHRHDPKHSEQHRQPDAGPHGSG